MRSFLKTLVLLASLGLVGNAVQAQVTGAIAVPSATYPDLNSVIAALNLQGVGAGGAVVNLSAGNPQTAPAGGYKLGSATLNSSLTAANSLTINGNGNTVTGFTGTSAIDGIFYLLGADYVTINALNLADAAANTTTVTQMEWGYVLAKRNTAAPFDGCQHDSIVNCNITLSYANAATTAIYAAHVNSVGAVLVTTGATAGDANSFNTFAGNTINAVRGIYLSGISTSVATYDKMNVVGGAGAGNTITIGCTVTPAITTCYGAYAAYDSAITFQGNSFSILPVQNAGNSVYEITFPTTAGTGVGNLSVINNTFNVGCSITTGAVGAFYNSSAHTDATSTSVISGNTISGNNTAGISNTLYGIYNAANLCASMTFSNNIAQNINWGTSTGNTYLLYNYNSSANSFTATGNLINNFNRVNTSTTSGGLVYGLYLFNNAATSGLMTVTNNKVKNIRNSGAQTYPMYIYGANTIVSGGQKLISKFNKVDSVDFSANNFTSSFDTRMGYYGGDSSEVAFDTVTNIKSTGTYTTGGTCNIYFVYFGNSSAYTASHDNYVKGVTMLLTTVNTHIGDYAVNIYNDTVTNISTTGGSNTNYLSFYGVSPEVKFNSISNITLGGSGSLTNYTGYFGTGFRVHDNIFNNFTVGAGNCIIASLYSGTTGNLDSFYNNNVSNVTVTSGISNNVYMIYAGGTADMAIYNNFITGLTVPATYAATNLYGMYLNNGLNYKIFHNTIKLSPVGSTTTFGLTGIYYSSAAPGTLDLRNNIINVASNPAGTGTVVALRRSSGVAGTLPNNYAATSNGNIFYAPNIANSYLYGEGLTNTTMVNAYNLANDPSFNTSCSLYKSFMLGRDAATFSENNLVAGPLPNTFVPASPSYAKSIGVITFNPSVTTDYANNTRPVVGPDAGALQFTSAVIDASGPSISYTSFTSISYCSTSPVLTATITDVSGVNTTTNAPRVYFKKSTDANVFGGANNSSGTGWKYVTATNTGSTFTFILNYSLLQSPPAPGEIIQYFVIAQDNNTTPNVGTNQALFTSSYCPPSVALAGATPVINTAANPINSFTIQTPPTTFSVVQNYKSLCMSGTTTLQISPVPNGTAIQWQQSVGGSAFADIPGATTSPYTTSLLTATTVFRAQLYCGGSVVATSLLDTISVSNPAVLTTAPATRCGLGPVTLGATTGTGALLRWYPSATSTTVLATGTSYTTPTIGASTTYYVSASVANAAIESTNNPLVPYAQVAYAPQYGEEFTLATLSNLYSATVYPNGTGTMQIQLEYASGAIVPAFIVGTNPITVPVSGTGNNSPQVIPLNWTNIPAGIGYRIVVLNITPATGQTLTFNYQYNATNVGYPFYSTNANLTVTNGIYAGAPFPQYYFYFYNLTVSGPCTSARTAVTATVTPAPAITASSPNSPGVCIGATANLTVSSANTGYTYSWATNPATTTLSCTACSSTTANPTVATTYVVTATDASGSNTNGCVTKDSVNLQVNAQPSPPTIAPISSTICQGSSVLLTGTPPIANPILINEGFESGTLGVFTNIVGSTTTTAAANTWNNRTNPYYSGISTSTGTHFAAANGDAGGPGNVLSAALTLTNSVSTMSFTSLTLTFKHFYQTYPNDQAKVEVSTDGGTTWTTMQNYAGATQGSASAFTSAAISMNAYINQPNLKIRFNYVSTYGWYWAVDSILLKGTGGASTLNWVNVNGLYKNPALSQPLSTSDTNKQVYASPAITTTYTAVMNVNGCFSIPSNVDTVKVNPSPNTGITVNPGTGICLGNTTTLTAVQTGPGYSYQWNNASGPIQGATNPTYTTSTGGSYTVKVTNTATGCTATTPVPVVIVINPTPLAVITPAGPTTICSGGTVQLNANTNPGTGPAYTYQWFDANGPIPNQNSPVFYAQTSGYYSVLITNTYGCFATSAPVQVTVNTTYATITPLGTTTFCNGYSVVLQANPGTNLTYIWQLNSAPIPLATNQSYTATVGGVYTVFVKDTVTNCSTTSSPVTVTVGPPPTAIVSPAGTVAVCDGSSLTLNTNSAPGLSYQWKKNTIAIPGANSQTYTQVFTTAGGGGSYTVDVSSGVGCTSTSAPTVVTVNPVPVVTITPNGPINFCQGGSVVLGTPSTPGLTYQWYNGPTLIIGATSSTYTAIASGSYTLHDTNSSHCQGISNVITVTVNPFPVISVAAAGPTTFCQGNAVTLIPNPTTGLTYQWNQNTFAIPAAAGGTGNTYSATTSGNYTVTGTNANGCSATSNAISVTVNPLPNVTTTPAGLINICIGSTVTISVPAAAGQTYTWSSATQNPIPGATTNSYTTGAAGIYRITATITQTGCSATSIRDTVMVNPPPVATASAVGNTVICQGDTAKLTGNAGTGFTYQWQLNGNNIIGATSQVYNATLPGVYKVLVTNMFGCSTLSNGITVTVNPVPPAFITYNSPLSFCGGGAVVLNANTGSGLTYEWYFNGGLIGNTGLYNVASQQGDYTIKVTNTFGCTATSAPVPVTVWTVPAPVIVMSNGQLTTGTYLTYQWFHNNQAIPGATGQTLYPTSNGAYKVMVTNSQQCSATSEQFFVQGLGLVSTPGVRNSINIYPNPATTILHVDAPVTVNLILRDVSGKAVKMEEGSKEMDITELANGMYLLYISDTEGHLLKAEKIAKTNN